MYSINKEQIEFVGKYIFRKDPLEKADAIFIPGCARPDHTIAAAELYNKGYAPLVIPSGGYTKNEGGFIGVKAGGETYGTNFKCEADFLEAVLLKHGVPQEAILKECKATYTLENAELSKKLLEEKGIQIKKAILCCKAYHARRSHLYYSMVFPEIEWIVYPVPIDDIREDNWYKTAHGREIVFGELRRMGEQFQMMDGRIEWENLLG